MLDSEFEEFGFKGGPHWWMVVMVVVIMMMVVVPMVVILIMKGGDDDGAPPYHIIKESFTPIKVIPTIRLMMSKLFDLNFYPYFDQVL